jgi:hypothetical protein
MKILLSIFLVSFFFVGCEMPNDQNHYEISQSEKAVNSLLHRIEISLTKKYKIKTIGTDVSMPGGDVRLLGLDFAIRGPLSKEEIRKILIDLVQEFLAFVNSDEAVRPYLTHYPFKIEDINIILFLKDAKGSGIDEPSIGIAEISRGILGYETIFRIDGIPSIKTVAEESYEEALKAISNH